MAGFGSHELGEPPHEASTTTRAGSATGFQARAWPRRRAAEDTGGKLPAALQQELDDGTAKGKELFGVAKAMANWELAMMVVGFGLLVSLFLPKRVIPLSVGGLLVLVAVLAIAMVPDIRLGIGQTSGFEIKAHATCAIIASVFGILASLIGMKKAAA
jgi:hypothetical protein